MFGLSKILKITLCAVLVLGVQAGFAQNSVSTLVFDTYEWNTGTIREVDGTVSRVFTFTNTADKPLSIERVKVDCGCTAPKYDNKPVAPGKKGTIEIEFTPEKYSGAFSKRVTIYSNEGQNRNVITVSGSVIGRPRAIEDDFPFELGGGIRAAELHKAFGYVENGKVKSMVIPIINNTPATAVISIIPPDAPTPGFRAAVPASLGAGERGDITLTYDLTRSSNVYGMLADRVFLSVNGITTALPLNVNAIGIDDFGNIDSSKAPKCDISPVYHNFGAVKPESNHTVQVRLTNKGKSPVIIREVSVRRNTQCSLRAGEKIMPGRTLTVPVTLKTGTADGVVAGGITMVLNDPERPFREIRIGADVF